MKAPLNDIACRFVERKWMRSQKAWRCSVELPTHPTLPSMLTGLIDSRVNISIQGECNIDIHPAFIVDVPHRGKRFSLVFETCFEQQATIGPYLTALPDTSINLTITSENQKPEPTVNSDPLTAKELKGLHVGFFRNERFWEYLGGRITSKEEAKQAFKSRFGVESCKDVRRKDFTILVRDFNDWLRGR